MINPPSFDDLTDIYEAMIDWPKRLAAEGPFFRQRFEQAGVKRIADVACGTGRHAALFHSWGLDVEGSDISPNMIQRARETFGGAPGLRWTVRGFDQPPGPPGSFDAVVCVGNSLALAADLATGSAALRQMFSATRPGGLVIIHVLNVWTLPDGPCVWQKAIPRMTSNGRQMIIKGVHRCGEAGFVELLVIDEGEKPSMRVNSVRFLGLRAADLESVARGSGAATVEFFGDHKGSPYDPNTSTDLIMIAHRG